MTTQGNDVPSRAGASSLIAASQLGAAAQQVLVQNLDETVLLGCIGLDADHLDSSDATLVSVVLDMSSSMASYKKAVIEAYNAMLVALAGAKAASAILVSTWAFADSALLLSSYEPVERKAKLCAATYAPNGCTALHDATLGGLTGLVAYGQQLHDQGVPTRRVLFVLSDGEDNTSRASALDVRTATAAVVKDEAFTLAYAGFGSTDLQRQADALGFTQAIATTANANELRRIFRQVSQSVLRVSQGNMPLTGGGFF